ncbi:MAG: DedA family protein [Leptospiraceae bacterium]|nr:DedA family protein [Leptospiraceae bacterium]MBK9501484.1 DedA family protein [Leptospiraceae bacterium]MBL0266397.1 DedA family protein [Leptospiraceae bacterium]
MDFLNLLVNFFSDYGYFAVFGVLILCGFGLPVPEDISLVAGGVISALGNTNEHIMFAVGMAGVLIGDAVVFTAGLTFGEKILQNRFVARIITPDRYDTVQRQFEKYGKWVVFMARFMPGLRTPIFLTAGVSKRVSFLRFFITDFLAAIISVPVWVYLGFYGASNFDQLMTWVRQGQITIFLLLAVVIIGFVVKKYLKRRNA